MRRRHEAVVTSISWIPGEAMQEVAHLPAHFRGGPSDDPPPEQLSGHDDLLRLREAGQFRCANVLEAWIEVDEEGTIVDLGYDGGGLFGSSGARPGGRSLPFKAAPFKDLRAAPEIHGSTARFVQTCGGRTGTPLPRRMHTPPYVRVQPPTIWTTLALELDAEGGSRFELLGVSAFPRHWVYGPDWKLAAKSGLVDLEAWLSDDSTPKTPWGDESSPAWVTAVESALERELSATIMRRGAPPRTRTLEAGELLTEQGAADTDLYVLLDGVLSVEVDGEEIAEVGPGALVGERAILEGGHRTATLRAVTRCKVATASPDEVDREALAIVAQGHRARPEPAP